MATKFFKTIHKKRIALAGTTLALLWVALFSTAMISIAPKEAHALRVTMKRIIFEGTRRAETITIVNSKATEQTFRLGWKEMRMTEDKALTSVDSDDDMGDLKTASDMIRYAPRRITLPPGGSQQVRLMLRRPRDLEDGEYRSHFWIAPEEEVDEFVAEKTSGGKPAVKLSIIPSITLPVFVRHGKLTAKGNITNTQAVRTNEGIDVSLTITREGNRSLYGDLKASCTASGDDIIYQVRGHSVYTEITKRNFKFSIKNETNDNVKGCKTLTLRYVSDTKDPLFNGSVIAETTVPVQ